MLILKKIDTKLVQFVLGLPELLSIPCQFHIACHSVTKKTVSLIPDIGKIYAILIKGHGGL
jgi:hypothetical protein